MTAKNKQIFGKWETTAILMNAISLKIFLNFPRRMVEVSGTAGWLLAIYVSLIAFAALAIILKLYKKFKGMDLLDIAHFTGGSTLKIITGLLFFGLLFFLNIVTLREFAEDIKVIALTMSPLSFVMGFFLICIIVGAYAGIETIARLQAIAVPVIVAAFVLILIGNIPNLDLYNLFPIMGSGANKLFFEGFNKIAVFSELVLLFFIVPHIPDMKTMKSASMTAVISSSIFLISSVIVYLGAFPYPTALENYMPIYQLSRLIEFGMFFQRVEPVFVIVWVASALLFLSTIFSISIQIFCNIFGIKDYKPMILPFGVILFTATFIPPSISATIKMDTIFVHTYSWVLTFVYVILLLAIAGIKKKANTNRKERRESASKG